MKRQKMNPDGDEQIRERVEQLIDAISQRLRQHADSTKYEQYERLLAMAEQYKELGIYASTAIFDMWERIEQQPENMANATRLRLQEALLPPEPEEEDIIIIDNLNRAERYEEDEDYEW